MAKRKFSEPTACRPGLSVVLLTISRVRKNGSVSSRRRTFEFSIVQRVPSPWISTVAPAQTRSVGANDSRKHSEIQPRWIVYENKREFFMA